MNCDLRILILEDVPNDAALEEKELRRAGIAFGARRVETREAFLRELKDFGPDLVLSDFSLPQFNGMEALDLVKERFPSIPVIIVTGSMNEETAVECMKKGAADYVLKDRLTRLGIAVRGALDNRKIKEEKERLEKILWRTARQWKSTFDAMEDAVCVLDRDGNIERCNVAFSELTKRPFQEIIGQSPCELLHGCAEPLEGCPLVRMGVSLKREIEERRFQEKWFRVTADPVFDEEGALVGCVHIMSDITTAKQQEEALRQGEARFRAIADYTYDWENWVGTDGRLLWVNPAVERITGYSPSEVLSMPDFPLPLIAEDDRSKVLTEFQDVVNGRTAEGSLEVRLQRKDGQIIWGFIVWQQIYNDLGEWMGHRSSIRDVTENKSAEALVRENEARFRSLVEHSHAAIFMLDESFRFIYANSQCFRLSGYPEEELIGSDFRKFVAEDSLALIADYYLRRQRGEAVPHQYEFAFVRKDGERRIGELSVSVITDATGNKRSVGQVLDITERKRAEEGLRVANTQLKDIIEFLPDATISVDRDKRIVAWNRAMELMTGVPKEEMVGKDHCMAAVPFYGNPRPILLDLLGEDGDLASKYSFVRRNRDAVCAEAFAPALHDNKGAYVWAIAAPLLDDDGAMVGAIESVRDITEQKLAETALRENEEKYRALFEQSRDPIIITSRKGAIVDGNQAALSLFGYTKDELLALEHVASLYDDDSDQLKITRLLKEKGFVKNYEMGYRRKDGKKLDCFVDITSRTDVQGRVVGCQGIVRDVTEYKQLQAQLFQAQKMEAVGRLSGSIAHDFNNLLTVIQGNAELALKKLEKEAPLQKILTPIHEASLQAAGLTSQLLLFSRKLPAERKPLDLNAVLEDRSVMLQRLIGEDVRLSFDLVSSPWGVMADRGRVEQVIMNLVVNARDAMPRGGRLTLKTTKETVDAGYCSAHADARPGKYLCLSVSDTGTGMGKEVMSQIFEPFFTTKGLEKGTGLGLAVVYGVVKDHGGWINVYSELGLGTTFRIYLPPYFESKETEPAEDETAEAWGGKGQRILIVEDEKALRNLARMVLSEGGYTVVTAKSAEEAIEVFEDGKSEFDLVFSDMVLPGKSGLEVVEELRAIKPSLRVLLCSGYTDEKSQWPMIEEKGYSLLHKPYAVDNLLKAVNEALEEHRERKT